MKIPGIAPLKGVYSPRGKGRAKSATAASSGPAAKVDISENASWISALRGQARSLDVSPRAEVVEQVRRELEEGTFEQNVDLDRTIDALLNDI